MALHESNVNFRNLIRDLTDMYTYDVSEVVITELIANGLDAKATHIAIEYDAISKTLVIEDNGTGMTAEQFRKYHDLAAGLKSRGSGIGFAGVGAKISFNIANCVVTETRSATYEGGSNWRLVRQEDGTEQLIWEDVKPSRLSGFGTRVEVDFDGDADIPYSTTEDIVRLLKRYYLPLFDKSFLDLYAKLGHYKNLSFSVNGAAIKPIEFRTEYKLDKAKDVYLQRSKKLIGYGILGLARDEYPLGDDVCGVLISVYGKVVKSELFSQFPGREGPRIIGVVEVPGLIRFLNTAKLDFIRPRGKYKEFEEYYGPIRDCFKQWLLEVGIQTQELDTTAETKKLERELAKILEEIPELGEFFGLRVPKTLLSPDATGLERADTHQGTDLSFPVGDGHKGEAGGPPDVGDAPGEALVKSDDGKEKASPISRTARRGPKIAFVIAPEKVELAWVEGNTIFINTGHPVQMKVKGDYKEKRVLYLVAVGCAVQRFLASQDEHADLFFLDRLLTAWGNK